MPNSFNSINPHPKPTRVGLSTVHPDTALKQSAVSIVLGSISSSLKPSIESHSLTLRGRIIPRSINIPKDTLGYGFGISPNQATHVSMLTSDVTERFATTVSIKQTVHRFGWVFFLVIHGTRTTLAQFAVTLYAKDGCFQAHFLEILADGLTLKRSCFPARPTWNLNVWSGLFPS